MPALATATPSAADAYASANDQRYLATLRTYWEVHKSFPSLAKLADLLGMSSTGSVFEMVARLEDAGYLTKKDGRVAPGKRFFAYPVLGTVRAGLPQPASDEAFEVLSVEELLIRDPSHEIRDPSCRACRAGVSD